MKMLEYPIPLREGEMCARLILFPDLSEREAEKLCNIIKTLIVPNQRSEE